MVPVLALNTTQQTPKEGMSKLQEETGINTYR